ncbi:MAG: flagellar FlbD family protein [Erysipelotrichaceae bacterium]
MIVLTKLNDVSFVLNDELIESISENPDTTITLTNGHMMIVKESMEEVVEKCIAYKQKVNQASKQGLEV